MAEEWRTSTVMRKTSCVGDAPGGADSPSPWIVWVIEWLNLESNGVTRSASVRDYHESRAKAQAVEEHLTQGKGPEVDGARTEKLLRRGWLAREPGHMGE